MKKYGLVLALAIALSACASAGDETQDEIDYPIEENQKQVTETAIEQIIKPEDDVPASTSEAGNDEAGKPSAEKPIIVIVDDKNEPAGVFIDSVQVILTETFPVQAQVIISGSLPDSCTEIQQIKCTYMKDTQTFDIQVLSFRPSDAMCAQMLTPFEESTKIEIEGLAAGTYTVNVQGTSTTFQLQADN